jgi:GDP-4-dehydro-6-deoxy-D-mannose reductase
VRPDAIFHLAGAASVGQSFSDPEGTWKVNVDGTRGVLEGMLRSAPDARMVIALSGEEYGCVPLDDLPVTEDTPLNPLSPYAESKVAADELCMQYRRDHGLAVLRLRAFNQLGPGQDPRFVVPSICKQIADAEMAGDEMCRLQLGNLETRRDFLDVRDVVDAYRLLIERGDPDQTYLAGRGQSQSVRALVDIAVSLARIPVEVESEASRVREGEQPDLYAEPRALKELGWAPRIPLEQSISDTLDYWRDRAHMEIG